MYRSEIFQVLSSVEGSQTGSNQDITIRERKEYSSDYLESCTDSQIKWSEDLIERMEDYYPGYRVPEGVKVVEPEKEVKGRKGKLYRGRGRHPERSDIKDIGENQPLIAMNNVDWKEVFGHEMGHDAEDYLEIDHGLEGIEKYTFREMFADLNMLHFTDLTPDSREIGRDPYSEDYEHVYSNVAEALNPENRKKELDELRNMEELLMDGHYTELKDSTEVFEIRPGIQYDENWETESCTNMFIDNMYHFNRLRELKENIFNHINSVENDEDLLIDTELKKNLETAISHSKYCHEQIVKGVRPKDVLTQISDVKYGKNWDDRISLPHNVGGAIAEEKYLNDITPLDILNDLETHVEDVKGGLRYTINKEILDKIE